MFDDDRHEASKQSATHNDHKAKQFIYKIGRDMRDMIYLTGDLDLDLLFSRLKIPFIVI